MATFECPCCKSLAISRGPIPDATMFAGRKLESGLPGGFLCACTQCGLNFRWPQIAKERLDSLYRTGSDASWNDAPENRHDWGIAKALLESLGATRILDVGCFDGTFLSLLSPALGRYGVEIHEAAADRARQRGIELVGRDLGKLSELDRRFDAVLAFDVVEHVSDPSAFLHALIGLLEPGGTAIVSTGNTAALSWRIMGSRYWYCRFAEHISFMNLKWFRELAGCSGVEIAAVHRFSHARATQSQKYRELAANLIYALSPSVNRFADTMGLRLRHDGRYGRLAQNGASWMSAKDHILVAFRKLG